VALTDHLSLAVRAMDDVLWARQEVRRFVGALGFGPADVERIDVAASELATNLVKHGGGGKLELTRLTAPRAGLAIVAEDQGPGIPDVAAAMADGFSTTGTYGAGLATLKELMDCLEIHSAPGRGTRVEVRKWA
jgi:serine/threonine-protein kinase RsbT